MVLQSPGENRAAEKELWRPREGSLQVFSLSTYLILLTTTKARERTTKKDFKQKKPSGLTQGKEETVRRQSPNAWRTQ